MSNEKIGKITESNGKGYKRTLPGINLPTDFMTDKEIEKLSGEVKTYNIYKDVN